MPTTWITCDIDNTQENQVQNTLADDGSITSQLIETWIVATDETSRSDPVDALGASVSGGKTLPALGDFIGDFQVVRVLPKRNGPYSFTVQVESKWKYTPPPPASKFSVSIDFSGQKFTQDAAQDMNEKPVVNSTGDSFNPTVPETFYDERIEVSYQTTADQSATFKTVRGKVNTSAISFAIQGVSRSFAVREMLCEDVKQSDSLPLGDGTPVFKVTASFTGRADTYITNVLDQGFYSLDSGDRAPIKDNAGSPVVTPAMLDGSGNVLAPGADPVFITFKIEKEADFTSIFTGLA
jgi:hypothetical protein